MKKQTLIVATIGLIASGCAVGPNYKRPKIDMPESFRGSAEAQPADVSFGDRKWPEVFGDETLNKLVSTALERNFDLLAASERIAQARAQYTVQRSNLFPFLDAAAQFSATQVPTGGSLPFLPAGNAIKNSFSQVGAALSWEVDLFGRLRRLTEAARARYLASEEGRRAIVVSLIGDVTIAYFQILELEQELEISRRTRDVAADSLRLVNLRREQGAASGLDLYQAEQLLYTATAQIEALERALGQTENALSLLLGQQPSAQPRGGRLADIPLASAVPPGLPSALLSRRPDVRGAEQELIAANAQIGAAKALYFPQISLTAFAGGQSRALSDIATTANRFYSIVPAAAAPIFRAGQVRGQVRLSEAQQRELLIRYQQTIYNALREVSDSLIGFSRTQAQRTQQQQLVRALEETVRLSNLRYKGGLDSYLQVLDAQRNLFAGQLVLSQLQLEERLTVVQLYRALGGGWQ